MNPYQLYQELGAITVMDHFISLRVWEDPIWDQIGPYLPGRLMADDKIESFQSNLIDILNELMAWINAKSMLMVGPELIFLEKLKDIAPGTKVFMALDSYLTTQSVSRISKNTPRGIQAKVLRVPELFNPLHPSESVMIVMGFHAGGRLALVPESSARVIQYYLPRYFDGEVLLLDLAPAPCLERPLGWISLNMNEYFTRHFNPTPRQGEPP